jgi:hypothetical protein
MLRLMRGPPGSDGAPSPTDPTRTGAWYGRGFRRLPGALLLPSPPGFAGFSV